MNNNNNSNARGDRPSRKRARASRNAAAPSGQPPQKKQKSAGQKRRQRNRRAQRDGRAQSTRGDRSDPGGDYLAGRGPTNNFSGYGNKASMPIWEREYIAEIQPTAEPAFSLQQFPVNPGQAAAFPWLAKIAQCFEKYEFEFLRFIYKREVSEFATNGVTGKVIMSFDSDATDAAPTTKQMMLDTDPHADGMPCESFFMDIPRSILKKFNDAHFVRPGAQPANTDLKTYDIGTLNVACQGTAANTVVGELHVEYALRLRVPVLEAGVGTSGSAVMQTTTGTVASPLLAGVTATNGSLALSQALTILTVTGLVVGSEYLVSYACSGVDGVTFGTLVGWTSKTYLGPGNGGGTSFNQGTFLATASTASLAITLGGAPTNAQAIVTQLPSTLF